MFHPPPPPQVSSSNRSRPREPKLRLSCDECAASKVKCDKKRPACDRCAGNGSSCVYSPSRKFGKPPSKKRFLGQQAPLMPASTGTSKRHRLNPLSPDHELMAHNLGDGDAFLNAWAEYATDEGLPSLPDLDTTFDFQFSDFPTMGQSHKSESPFSQGNGEGQEDLDLDQILAQRHPEISTWGNLNLPSPRALAPEEHNCQDRAYATLATLHCRTSNIQAAYSSNGGVLPSLFPNLPGSTNATGPTMDKVLSINKAALVSVSKLLDCSCAQDPHLAMLYVSIIFKILVWYEVASGIRPSLDHFTTSSSLNTAPFFETCKSSSPKSIMPSNGVVPTQIQVGGHILDEDDQIMLQRDLLLREVRKVEKVIDRMSVPNEDSRPSNSEESKARNWYCFASTKLQEELQNTMKRIMDIEAPSRTPAV